MKNQKSLFALFCIMTIGLLVGCDSSSTTGTGSTTHGVFTDADVVGVTYTCGTQSAVTGTGGAFTCPGGGTVTFTVGPITLCKQLVQAIITPVSCAQSTDPTANASTPSVIAVTRFLMTISTTLASSGSLTITPGELTAAAGLSLDFSTATDAQLQAAVNTIRSGASLTAATLVTAAAAQAEITNTVLGVVAGTFTGTFSGGSSGTWTATFGANGSVTGSGTDSQSHTFTISGALTSGTVYSGTAGSASWTGNLDTSKTPAVIKATWTDSSHSQSGTFTGKKQ